MYAISGIQHSIQSSYGSTPNVSPPGPIQGSPESATMRKMSAQQALFSSPEHYTYIQPAAPLSPLQTRPARLHAGAWTPPEDAILLSARASGQNWLPIQVAYFPNKTSNACRKRHERLMDKRHNQHWNAIKLETMSKAYMDLRRDMWMMLAERTGEKWSVLESKCMNAGLKNLAAAGRACSRRSCMTEVEKLNARTMANQFGTGDKFNVDERHNKQYNIPTNAVDYVDFDSGISFEPDEGQNEANQSCYPSNRNSDQSHYAATYANIRATPRFHHKQLSIGSDFENGQIHTQQ